MCFISEKSGVLGLGVLGSESGISGPRSRNVGVPGLGMLGSDVKLERLLGQESPWWWLGTEREQEGGEGHQVFWRKKSLLLGLRAWTTTVLKDIPDTLGKY